MKYIAIIFLSYEVFKLIRLRSTLEFFVNLKNNILVMDGAYHVLANALYLIFAIVLVFFYPVFGLALLGVSAIMWLFEKSKSIKVYSAALIGDGLASLAILTTFILKG